MAQTLERLKIATFYTAELLEACEAPSAQVLATSIKAGLVKGNALIQLSYRAASSADGVSLLMLKALSKREELAQLQKQLLEQSVQLSAPITQPLQLLEPIDAPDRAVFPKKLPTLAGGVLGGLMLGGTVFFLRRSWLGRKTC